MLFKFYSNLFELPVNLGHRLLHFAQRHRSANAGHHVFALGIHKIVAVENLLARTRIASEADAGTGSVAGISEDHLHDVDGGTEQARNFLDAAIGHCLLCHPGTEHGANRSPKLINGVIRKIFP